jgi:tripartite-type tricarboxylate transporter receptor subunit TctC
MRIGNLQAATLRGLLGLGMLAATMTGAAAQDSYPTGPIDFIVPFAAGGGGDTSARVFTKFLSEELGQTINVINMPGGNTIRGVYAAMSATPDGYTLLMDGIATSSLQVDMPNLPYKVADRTFGPRYHTGPYFIAVNAQSSYKTLSDLVSAIKSKPGELKVAWLGGTSLTDTVLLSFLDVAGIPLSDVKLVPFNGSGPAATALAGGHIDVSLGAVPAIIPLAGAGTVRVLALAGDQRAKALPDVPSSKEAGYFVPLSGWNGIAGPPGLPANVVARLEEATKKVTEDPAFAEELAKISYVPLYVSSEDNKRMVFEEAGMLARIRENAGLAQ